MYAIVRNVADAAANSVLNLEPRSSKAKNLPARELLNLSSSLFNMIHRTSFTVLRYGYCRKRVLELFSIEMHCTVIIVRRTRTAVGWFLWIFRNMYFEFDGNVTFLPLQLPTSPVPVDTSPLQAIGRACAGSLVKLKSTADFKVKLITVLTFNHSLNYEPKPQIYKVLSPSHHRTIRLPMQSNILQLTHKQMIPPIHRPRQRVQHALVIHIPIAVRSGVRP